MTEQKKRRAVKRAKPPKERPSSVLGQFHCKSIDYELDIPLSLLDFKAFRKAAGVPSSEWFSGILRPKWRATNYHAHFRGRVDRGRIHFTIVYYEGGTPQRGDQEPFAETIMQFIGSFVKEPSATAFITARFSKPKEHWRAKFNLPFKVTMGDSEVTIDGISLDLPKNKYRAIAAFLAISDDTYDAAVNVVRPLQFARFDIGEEIASFNEATKIFLEQSI